MKGMVNQILPASDYKIAAMLQLKEAGQLLGEIFG